MTELTVSRELQRGQRIVPKTSRAPHKKAEKCCICSKMQGDTP